MPRPLALVMAAFALVALSCASMSVTPSDGSAGPDGDANTTGPASLGAEVSGEPVDQLDILVVMDNSGSMFPNQALLVAQLRPLFEALTNPPDLDGNGRPDALPPRSIHVGVVSTDLGTAGASIPGCANAESGDDGLLNPIRNGQATARHEPWISAPIGFRPDDCTRPDQFPSFLTFSSGASGLATFVHDVHCNVTLMTHGCGLEQPLEAVHRAIVWRRADDRPGNTDPNAGFLREDAVLAIVVISDEEDGSVRDCRYAEPGVACSEATDVFQMASTPWGSPSLNLRFYLYPPGSAQDPTWPLDRYVDPRNPARGYLSVKPRHPERIVCAAITGVPLTLPTRRVGNETLTDWTALLGRPAGGDVDNLAGRDNASAYDNPTEREGPTSMRQANLDPACVDRVVPACRREGSSYNPASPPCQVTEQYFAWPARRIVEIARRMDEAALCAGRPCRNGIVVSACHRDYAAAGIAIAQRIQSRLGGGRCVLMAPPTRQFAEGTGIACRVRQSLPAGSACRPEQGRVGATDDAGRPVSDPLDASRVVCDMAQLPVLGTSPVTSSRGYFPSGERAPTNGVGYFFDTSPDPITPACLGRVAFTSLAALQVGVRAYMDCP